MWLYLRIENTTPVARLVMNWNRGKKERYKAVERSVLSDLCNGMSLQLHTFITMEFSMEFTHITFCEIEDFFVNEEGGMLTNRKSALNQKPYVHQTVQLHKYMRILFYT